MALIFLAEQAFRVAMAIVSFRCRSLVHTVRDVLTGVRSVGFYIAVDCNNLVLLKSQLCSKMGTMIKVS